MGAGYDPVCGLVGGICTSVGNLVSQMDFWSITDSCVSVTACPTDIALPSVTVDTIPCGVTVIRAMAMMKYAKAVNTNVCCNSLVITGCNTPALQIKCDGGCAWVDGHLIVTGQICLPGCGREGGDLWMGSICVTGTVCGNDIYCFRFCDIEANLANITLKCLQTGVRVYFTV